MTKTATATKSRPAARTKPHTARTVTHEKGKLDNVADASGSVTQAPEGTGETGNPTGAKGDDCVGWINGEPATLDEVRQSTGETV